MNKLKQKIINLYSLLKETGIITDIHIENSFTDEAKMFRFNALLSSTKSFSDGHSSETTGGGFSFFNNELAFLKCLVESAERFCTMCYREKNTIESTYLNLKQPALDPTFYPNAKQSNFRWSKGLNLLTNKTSLIPTQLIYYTYHYLKDEPFLTELNSTGAAGGFEKDITILRGIYEIVERDAFMTMYLAKLPCSQINLSKLKNKKIDKIIESANRYNLDVKVFNITNDLEIPSFMGMLIDKTGLGPCISIGLKSSLDPLVAIIGCMEEAFHTRPWVRREIQNNKLNNFNINPKKINSIKDRALYWLSPKMLSNLDFLFSQPMQPLKIPSPHLAVQDELDKILKTLKKHKCNVYFTDTTIAQLKKIGFLAFKIIIPGLQPLYLQERNKEIRIDRLKNAALYHGIKKININPIPHPFL